MPPSSSLIKRLSSLAICKDCAHRLVARPQATNNNNPLKLLTSTHTRQNKQPLSTTPSTQLPPPTPTTGMGRLPDLLNPRADPFALESMFGSLDASAPPKTSLDIRPPTYLEKILPKTYHLHILAHKHNTHMTLTRPNRDPMLSLSTGNLSFRKSNRGTYEAASQLASYFFGKIQERGWMREIEYSEIVFRGFGHGREAVTKCLMGSEGRVFRATVVRVGDHTRLKFGGTRSRKPRRLG